MILFGLSIVRVAHREGMSIAVSNPIVIRKGLKLGELAAEADEELLGRCFVNNGIFSRIEDVSDPGAILIGRTGAGKSALVLHVGNTKEHSITIDPADVSIRFLEHSNIIEFLSELNVKLDIFYKALWRHIITIELLRMRYRIKNSQDGRSIFDRIARAFDRDSTKKKAIAYLEEWSDKFWLETDEQLREITKRLDRDVRTGLGVEYSKVAISAKAVRELSEQDRVEITSRASRVVSAIQIKKLEEVVGLLEDHAFNDPQKRYFILIDKLDENWASTTTRCRFIRALIEEIKFFRKMPHVKIIVALRDDLLELVYARTRDSGFQEEKYEAYMVPVQWSKDDLRQLLEKRIAEVFRRQYTKGEVGLTDVFPTAKKGGGETSIDYMVERTLHRPRDLLQFANECFALAHDRERISWRVIFAAEASYSKKRMKSLFEEWVDIYPSLDKTVEILRGLPSPFTRSMLTGKRLDELLLSLVDGVDGDPCVEISRRNFSGPSSPSQADVLNAVIQCLYRIGVAGIKISSLETFTWSFIDQSHITPSEAKRANQLKVHKMLHRYLEVRATRDADTADDDK